MSRQTPSARLLARLKTMGLPVDDSAPIERTYAGAAMRANGAWLWRTGPVGVEYAMVGSRFPVTALLREDRLCAVRSPSAPEWSIWPYTGHVTNPNELFLIEPERSTR